MNTQSFDLIILGGGLAGAALACALGDSGLHIALLDAQPLARERPPLRDAIDGFDARVSAITAASQQWLQALGAWDGVAAQRLSPYRHMHVWDAEGVGHIDFDCGEVNAPLLGYIVENGLLQGALLHRIASQRGVQLLCPATVKRFDRAGNIIELQLADGRRLATPLLIGADGARSAVRGWAGIATREWDYGHHAIVATVATERPHQATAWQIFRREGPLAFLPLRTTAGDDHFCSIVWSTEEQHADELMALDDNAFAAALGRAFEQRLGAIAAVSRRHCFPLRARFARAYTATGVALIGDAAHTMHPLAGQGINLGFGDARALAGELLRARQRGLPLDHPSVLARYQRARKGENLAMLAAMEGFKRLFGAHAPALTLLRNRGLDLVDGAGPLKRLLIRRAMGIVA